MSVRLLNMAAWEGPDTAGSNRVATEAREKVMSAQEIVLNKVYVKGPRLLRGPPQSLRSYFG